MLAEPLLKNNAEGVTSIEVEHGANTVSELLTESQVSEDQAEIDIARDACVQQCVRAESREGTGTSVPLASGLQIDEILPPEGKQPGVKSCLASIASIFWAVIK